MFDIKYACVFCKNYMRCYTLNSSNNSFAFPVRFDFNSRTFILVTAYGILLLLFTYLLPPLEPRAKVEHTKLKKRQQKRPHENTEVHSRQIETLFIISLHPL